MREATREAEEIRLFAERALWLATRLQLIVGVQAELAVLKTVTHPEFEQILSDTRRFTDVAERLAGIATQWPEKIAAEYAQAIDQLLSPKRAHRKAAEAW